MEKGKLERAAALLGLHRRHLYRICYREKLWDDVDAIRAKHEQARQRGPEWLNRTREALKRDHHGVQGQ